MKKALLVLKNLHVRAGEKDILRGIDLSLLPGEIHVVMGRNGQGKSTLAHALAGAPGHQVTEGAAYLKGKDMELLAPHERAAQGLFVAFQQPIAIPGLTVINFLKASLQGLARLRGEKPISTPDLLALVKKRMADLGIPDSFISRSLHDGFSGGEKKRLELLQMVLLDPDLAILDETDSGLDADAAHLLGKTLQEASSPKKSFIIITHYTRLLEYITPTSVHILEKGRIIHTGHLDLAKRILREGYEPLLTSLAS